jgi:tetratricopeptide (TPR) repeat protein
MPYQPWKQDPFEPNKQFTDRESFRKILQDAVNTPQQPDEHKMLVIYGAGGQGKSALKEWFGHWLNDSSGINPSLVHVHLDFEYVERNRQVDEALLGMAEQLMDRHKVPLPCFSFGILRYKKMVHPEKNLENLYPYLFKLKGLESEIYQEIISLVADASGVLGIGLLLKKGTGKLLEWLKRRDVNKLIGNLDELSASQLLNLLPHLLAFDLYQEMEQGRVKGKNKRFVFLMDGYESLWRFEVNRKTDKDEWIRKLVLGLPGALFVAFGRDRLRWAETENDPDLDNILQQFLLTGLLDSDADHYLQQVPVPEKEIRDAIISSSKSKAKPEEGCLPFYLSLQVDTYARIRNQDKPVRVEDFGGSEQKIINHFFEHINIITANAIQVLSIPNIINEEIIEELIRKNYISPSAITVADLKSYSFIYADNHALTMHSLMREMCMKQLQQDAGLRYQHIHEALFNYFNNRLPVLPADNGWSRVSGEWELVLEQAAYHKAIYDSEHFADWILEKTAFVHTLTAWKAVPNILEKAAGITRDPVKKARLIKRLANCYGHINNYEKKKDYLELAIRLFDSILTNETLAVLYDEQADPEEKKYIHEIVSEQGDCYMGIAETAVDNDKLLDAEEAYSRARQWAIKYNLSFDHYKHALFLMQVGRVADCEPVMLESYYEHRKAGDKWSQGIAAHDLSKLFSRQGRYSEAKRYSGEAAEYLRKFNEKDSVDNAIVMLRMASILIKEGISLDKALEIIADCEMVFIAAYGEDNWQLHFVYAVYGDLYSAMNNIEQALNMYNKALAFLRKSPNNRDFEQYDMLIDCTALLFSNVADDGHYRTEYEGYSLKFLTLMANDFPLVKNCMGINTPSFRRGMELYITLNEYIGNSKESDEMRRLQQEFNRVLKHQGYVRVDGFKCSVLADEEKDALLGPVKDLTSLPEDFAELEVTQIHLPFYKTYALYQIRFTKVEPWYAKYVLTNGDKYYVFNRKNEFIYKANEEDLFLKKESLSLYIRFFFDIVGGIYGSFYPVESVAEIPWRLDKDVPEGLTKYMKELINPFPWTENEESWQAKSWIIFKEDVFLCDMEINKKTGLVSLSNQCLCMFYQDADGNYSHLYSRDLEEKANEKNRLSLPIGVTPQYDKYFKEEPHKPYILQERIEVRTDELTQVPIEHGRLPELYNKLRALAELPEDITSVEVQEYILPFYKTARLLKVTQTTTQTPVYHYFIGNDKEMEAFSWTNEFIYKLGESELVLNDETSIPYIKFFFDSVMGRHGRFFVLNGPADIPWTERAVLDGELEKSIIRTVDKIHQLPQRDADFIIFEAYIIFTDSLFKAEIHINSQNGIVAISDEHLIVFTSNQDGIYTPSEFTEEDDRNYVDVLPVNADPVIPFKQEISSIIRSVKAAKLFCQITGLGINGRDLSALSESVARNGIIADNKEATLTVLKEYGQRLKEKLPAYAKVLGEHDEFIVDQRKQLSEIEQLIAKIIARN